jgi:hypothetical protein
MLRILLYYVVPFLLPFVGFFTYRYLVTDGRTFLQNTPWFWLTTAGLALVVVSLFTIAFTGGWDVEGDYAPPRLEDGRIVPGEVRVPAGEVIDEPGDAPPDADATPLDGN